MKLIIDISEEYYSACKSWTKDNVAMIEQSIIAHGTPYDEKRPRGEWIYKKFDEKTGISDSYFCSHCDFPLTGIYTSYCAVCGADMRIKKEGI